MSRALVYQPSKLKIRPTKKISVGLGPCTQARQLAGSGGEISSWLAEREFPALLVVWAYQQKKKIGRGQFFLARKKIGVFFVFWGCHMPHQVFYVKSAQSKYR